MWGRFRVDIFVDGKIYLKMRRRELKIMRRRRGKVIKLRRGRRTELKK